MFSDAKLAVSLWAVINPRLGETFHVFGKESEIVPRIRCEDKKAHSMTLKKASRPAVLVGNLVRTVPWATRPVLSVVSAAA
jgi:hypothetical protein